MNKLGIWAIAIVAAFVVGILSANPVVEAVGGWKAAVIELNDDISDIELFLEERSDFWEFLEESGEEFFESQIYEVSGVSVIPPVVESGDEVGSPVQLRCLDGDWFLKTDENPNHSVVLSTDAIPVDRTDIRIIGKGNFVLESEAGIEDEFEKTIGWDGFAEILFLESTTFSDIPVTITGLCQSPSP